MIAREQSGPDESPTEVVHDAGACRRARFGSAQLRVDRRLDAIQCIEAIRIYGAAHGKLPSSLKDITEAPVPLDVATGQPFDYRVDGDHAILSAPSPRGCGYSTVSESSTN